MATEDKSQFHLFSPEDEKEAQRELDRLRKNQNGLFKVNHKRTGFEDKTLWDWLQLLGLLAIPLVVVGATILFGIQQANLADQQHANDQKIANQQHEADQKQALDQQQAAILQTYIDNIQDLLLNHNLLKSKPTDDVAILARARTLTALQGLDPDRKGRLMQFIYEAQLIGFLNLANLTNGIAKPPIIDLFQADLSYAIFNPKFGTYGRSEASLAGADFSGANLNGANLSYTFLEKVDLTDAVLNDAVLANDTFDSANLSDANLNGANLVDTYLRFANLSNTNLTHANLSNTEFGDADLTGADLIGANLNGANLTGAELSYANLSGVEFRGALLRGATFTRALLIGADLRGATLTQQQLDQVQSCRGATLPRGLTCHQNA